MTNYATAANFLRLHLYGDYPGSNGEFTTPELLTDRLRDLAPDAPGATIGISAAAYMSSYGIYAVPARAQFVQEDFRGHVPFREKVRVPIPRGQFSEVGYRLISHEI